VCVWALVFMCLSAKRRTKYANDIRPCSITPGTFRPRRWSATRKEALDRFLSVRVENLKVFPEKVNEKKKYRGTW